MAYPARIEAGDRVAPAWSIRAPVLLLAFKPLGNLPIFLKTESSKKIFVLQRIIWAKRRQAREGKPNLQPLFRSEAGKVFF